MTKIDNYALTILLLYIIYNIILRYLLISGMLYQLFMYLLIIINNIILIKYRKHIKYKTLIIIIYLLLGIFSKNIFQYLFGLSNIIVLIIIGFKESRIIKIISILVIIISIKYFILILFILAFTFGNSINSDIITNDIYEKTHYYCNNHYEAYAYSKGAMDKYHYSIGKHYVILNLNDIIYISYNQRNEVSNAKYNDYINKNNCRLVSDKYESK